MPTVQTAIIFNTQSGIVHEMSAADFEREFHGKEVEKDFLALSPGDGTPLTFRRSHYREGREAFVRACWVRPPGFGDHDHVFDHDHKTLMEALKADKSTRILLSLNGDLTHHSDLSFKNMKEDGAQNLENWIAQNKGRYVSVSINDASQAISTIKKVSAEIGKQAMDSQVFALHRGAVVPYRHFYLGPRLDDIAGLYKNLQNGQSGVAIGETRMIGFPRLIRFMPTETTQREKGSKGLKGNRIDQPNGKPIFSSLIFSGHDDRKGAPSYKELSDEVIREKGGVYVLACPSVTVGQPKGDWKMIRWIINNTDAQTEPLKPDAKAKLKEHADHESRQSSLSI